MMGVVHNVQYFYWFEQGRMQIMEEFMSLDEAMKLGVAMPVVENQCLYKKPVRYGVPLILLTEHVCPSTWEGRLVFSHSLVHRKLKTEMACGRTTATLIDAATGRLVKEWPEDLWRRYLALADRDQLVRKCHEKTIELILFMSSQKDLSRSASG